MKSMSGEFSDYGDRDPSQHIESDLESKSIDILQSARVAVKGARDLDRSSSASRRYTQTITDVQGSINGAEVAPIPPMIRVFLTQSGNKIDDDILDTVPRIYITTIDTKKFAVQSDHSGLTRADFHLMVPERHESTYSISQNTFDLTRHYPEEDIIVRYDRLGSPYEAVNVSTEEAIDHTLVKSINVVEELRVFRDILRRFEPSPYPVTDDFEQNY